MINEEQVWETINSNDIWVLDKLILSRKLNYICGPIGTNVPKPDWYIIRPCVNALGLGLGAKKIWIEKETNDLPYGFFWCEWFEGRHLSVDYENGNQILCVEGIKPKNTFTKWQKWFKTDDVIQIPDIIKSFIDKYKYINCEFIGYKLIEVHFRNNPDFVNDISEYIPVWKGQSIEPPEGYIYVEQPELNDRIGAFIK